MKKIVRVAIIVAFFKTAEEAKKYAKKRKKQCFIFQIKTGYIVCPMQELTRVTS